MNTHMMPLMKELEAERRRLKEIYIEEKLKAEIATEPLEKNSTAVSPTCDRPMLASEVFTISESRFLNESTRSLSQA